MNLVKTYLLIYLRECPPRYLDPSRICPHHFHYFKFSLFNLSDSFFFIISPNHHYEILETKVTYFRLPMGLEVLKVTTGTSFFLEFNSLYSNSSLHSSFDTLTPYTGVPSVTRNFQKVQTILVKKTHTPKPPTCVNRTLEPIT